jgi:hypothetical protein
VPISFGYMDEQFNMLLGYTKATTTGTYGILPERILSERAKMIEAVEFLVCPKEFSMNISKESDSPVMVA